MITWPPQKPISTLITEIESTGITLSVVGDKIRSTPSGCLTPEQIVLLQSRRDEILYVLRSRDRPPHHIDSAAGRASATTDVQEAETRVWLLFEDIHGQDAAILQDDFEMMKQTFGERSSEIFGDGDFDLHMKRNGRRRYVPIPINDYPTCWKEPREHHGGKKKEAIK